MAAKKATKKKAEPSVPMVTVRRFNKELQKRELMTIKKADIIPTGYTQTLSAMKMVPHFNGKARKLYWDTIISK